MAGLIIYAQLIERLLPSLWDSTGYLYTLVGKNGQSTFILGRKVKQTTNRYVALEHDNDSRSPQSVLKLCEQTDITKADMKAT